MWFSGKLVSPLLLTLFCFYKSGSALQQYSHLGDANGGWNCLSCTVVVSLVEQLAIINNSTIEQSLDKLCNFLPAGLFRYSCQQAIELFGPIIINGYTNHT